MTGFLTGPAFVVHILIITAVNAILFPLIYGWSGSILYAFLISVGGLCLYGLLAYWILWRKRR